MRKTMIAALALAATTTQAHAGKLGVVPPVFDGYVSGRLDTPGPQKWTVDLRRGGSYAVAARPDGAGTVSVHAAGGRTLVSVPVDLGEGWIGAGFTAPYTGSYTVQVACVATVGCPGSYYLRVVPDCRGDAATACRIAPGRTLAGDMFGDGDVDWVAVDLAKGRTYQVSADAKEIESLGLCLAVLDRGGHALLHNDCASSFTLSFKAPATGTYFIEAQPQEFPSVWRYTLTVK